MYARKLITKPLHLCKTENINAGNVSAAEAGNEQQFFKKERKKKFIKDWIWEKSNKAW